MSNRRVIFHIAWLLSIFPAAFHPNRITISLNRAFFTVGVGWMLLDCIAAFRKAQKENR